MRSVPESCLFDEITGEGSSANLNHINKPICRDKRTASVADFFRSPSYRAAEIQRVRGVCRTGQPFVICALTSVIVMLIILVAVLSRTCDRGGVTARRSAEPVAPGDTVTFPPLNKRINSDCPQDFPWNGIRLPNYARPLHYRLLIHPNLTSFTFAGWVEMQVETVEPSSLFVIHAKDLRIDGYDIRPDGWSGDKTAQVKISRVLLCDRQEQMALRLTAKTRPNRRYNITISFRGNLTDDLIGLYRSEYKTSNDEKKYMAITQFQPTDARASFPCFDEPAYKANYSVSIVRDSRSKSLTNMPFVRAQNYTEYRQLLIDGSLDSPSVTMVDFIRKEKTDDLYIDFFITSLRMSTYVVAMAVFDFPSIVNYTTNNVKVAVYAPEPQINQTYFAMEIAVDSLNWLESFFKVPYPLPKQALVAVADFAAGAMENWGMVTFRDRYLLYDRKESSSRSKHIIAEVIMHELSHQWFGNLVTMNWWNDLWLNEGFATFIEDYGVSKIRPEWNTMSQYYADVMCNAMALDGLSTSHPISAVIDDPADIVAIFDEISYDKAGSMIYMLLQLMGEEKLKIGLQDYLEEFKFRTAESKDLWQKLEKQVPSLKGLNLKLTSVMDSWAKQLGYPYVHVTLENNQLRFRQSRFLYLTSKREAVESSRSSVTWYIPLSVMTDENREALNGVWLTDKDQSFDLNGTSPLWFKANVEQSGFYRTMYDISNWEALANQLLTDHQAIGPLDRAGIINDAFSFVKAGLLHLNYSLTMVKYLPFEEAAAPWDVALTHLKYIETMLDDTALFPLFREYVRSLLEPVYTKVGWTLNTDHQKRLLQVQILTVSCHFNVMDCIGKAQEIFATWMATNESIDPDLRVPVYFAVAEGGNFTDLQWDFLLNSYNTTFSPQQQSVVLSALATVDTNRTVERLLDMLLDPSRIRPRDIPLVFSRLGVNPVAKYITWRFIQSNWNRLVELLGITTNLIGTLLKQGLSGFKTEFDLMEMRTFFATRDMGSNVQAADQLLETIEINIQWLRYNYEPLTVWLNEWNQGRQGSSR